ncbi:FG-GAP-like repeat-containing protein [Dyadobacter chenwenxiniae]|uniref:FG-GAP-like repeat-containing protein n=1 Tax=Dyadobacter chenwenxiniae TaxID=2906456 RepID=A0A9X1TG90_9BACT|nr:FG-GAP-like repeat-containing protein [Dyadobacter chenwenxiniae]MCF0065261.1 FG-GAP-like repeat-containing protein [Dyadobacter chenwenxiniae]UON84471.1 FG-GAP-like repeat-containing protein [Dyadobacter chenwenxiniae]
MRQLLPLCISLFFLISCNVKKQNETAELKEPPVSTQSGRELAATHCSRCHAFIPPALLGKSNWKKVLPDMHERMGPILAKADWQKIEQYFLTNAPDSIAPPIRTSKIRMGLKHFKYRETSFSHRPAMTSMVKILPDNRGIVYSDAKGKSNVLTFLKPDLSENYSMRLESTPIDFFEKGEALYLTMIGNGIFPTDARDGALQRLVKNGSEKGFKSGNIAISNLQRPVSMAYGDLNKDGFEDVVACEFGNETGQLAWFENNGRGGYDKRILREKPGAITAIIKDANKDGLMDIYVLMAQADEGIFLYMNQGAGKFEEKRLLSFMPLNGSQHMELADFNKDGFDDIVYVCGDNADKTPILKNYHGIYIFLNDGKSGFKQSYFYQMNGAYKAMVRDYDLDGDPDIAAISFFPDYARYPEESFIYLKNKGSLKFEDYSFPESPKGRWIVMDAGDMDADGDADLVLGSFVHFLPLGDKTGLGKKWVLEGPSVIVLENTIR